MITQRPLRQDPQPQVVGITRPLVQGPVRGQEPELQAHKVVEMQLALVQALALELGPLVPVLVEMLPELEVVLEPGRALLQLREEVMQQVLVQALGQVPVLLRQRPHLSPLQ